ncbi:MAG: hypothetical protein EAX96_07500 [Candidatus Lokiarchaeota archaeon]|nr:hypothetical protein [Candidatus Lokiarchaeota archaeon]
MFIKIKEKDQDAFFHRMRVHWDEKSKSVVGNIVDFTDELMRQSGFAAFFYHLDFWTPISIIKKREYETEDDPSDYIYEIEIEDIIDDQLTGTEGKSTEYNTWYGRYGQKSELVQYINNRYKYYVNLAIKKFNIQTESMEETESLGEEEKEKAIQFDETSCFICGITDKDELLIAAKKRGKNLWICSKCIPKTSY